MYFRFSSAIPNIHVTSVTTCRQRLLKPNSGLLKLQGSYKAGLLCWLLNDQQISYAEFDATVRGESEPWVLKTAQFYLTSSLFGPASYQVLINWLLRHSDADTARVAAVKAISDGVAISPPHKEINEGARIVLHAAGKIRRIGKPPSLLGVVLHYVLSTPQTAFNWAQLMGANHKIAEAHALHVKSYFETSIDAFIVSLDSLFDLVFRALWAKHNPGRICPDFGSALSNPTMSTKFPKVCAGLTGLHQKRLESSTAHPIVKRTGAPTRRLRHRDFQILKLPLQDALSELVIKA